MNEELAKELLKQTFLSIPDVAQMLDIGPWTVKGLIQAGKLEAINVAPGDKKPNWKIKASSVRKFTGFDEPVTAQ